MRRYPYRALRIVLAIAVPGCVGHFHERRVSGAKTWTEPRTGLQFVRLGPRPLDMMQTDVPVRAYAACAAAGRCNDAARKRDEPHARCNWAHDRSDHPMNCVTWAEAVAFCDWIAARLPTGDEWTFAAASGDTTRAKGVDSSRAYPWGVTPVNAHLANYCDVECPKALGTDSTDGKNLARWERVGWIDRSQNDGFAATSPVGHYPAGATPWGLYDMAGNVWQWTSTPGPVWTIPPRAGSPAGAQPMKLDTYEVRGGSWDNPATSLNLARRLPWPARSADAGMGFRCVRPDSSPV